MLLHSRDLPSAKYKVSHYSQNQIQIPAASLLICSTGLAVQSLVCRIRHWRWLNYTKKGTGTSLKLVCWRYHVHLLPLTQGTTSWALVIRANGITALPRLPSPPSPTARLLKNQLQPVLTRAGGLQDAQTSAAGLERHPPQAVIHLLPLSGVLSSRPGTCWDLKNNSWAYHGGLFSKQSIVHSLGRDADLIKMEKPVRCPQSAGCIDEILSAGRSRKTSQGWTGGYFLGIANLALLKQH